MHHRPASDKGATGGEVGRDHDHGHDHDHDHDHDDHDHGREPRRLRSLFGRLPFFHGHSHAPPQLDTLASTSEGLRVVVLSFAVLMTTAVAQVVIVVLSGSVALLADTIHNFGDALTAVPLGIAFVLGRRLANNRYTYGYGRAEDIAGVIIVLLILFSAVIAAWQSIERLLDPRPIELVWVVAAAALIGFAGNELVAEWRIRTGRRIGSAALVADGKHARVDGLTSLAVLGAVAGTLVGFPILDPIIGLVITAAILMIVKDQGLVMWRRMMDAVDPAIVDKIRRVASEVAGVENVSAAHARWIGHRLYVELDVEVDETLTTREGHEIAENVSHYLYHEVDHCGRVQVHVNPHGPAGHDHHRLTAHHVT